MSVCFSTIGNLLLVCLLVENWSYALELQITQTKAIEEFLDWNMSKFNTPQKFFKKIQMHFYMNMVMHGSREGGGAGPPPGKSQKYRVSWNPLKIIHKATKQTFNDYVGSSSACQQNAI